METELKILSLIYIKQSKILYILKYVTNGNEKFLQTLPTLQ